MFQSITINSRRWAAFERLSDGTCRVITCNEATFMHHVDIGETPRGAWRNAWRRFRMFGRK